MVELHRVLMAQNWLVCLCQKSVLQTFSLIMDTRTNRRMDNLRFLKARFLHLWHET